MTTTITTYLGEQLSTEPDRLRLEIESDGTIANVWLDGIPIVIDLLDLVGRKEFDRLEQLAIDTAYEAGKNEDSPRDRAAEAYMAACKARREERR